MPAKSERIETKELVGESYEIPINHKMAHPHAYRRDELDAINRWAQIEGIQLRSEATLSLTPGENGARARVLTYDYKAMMATQPITQHEEKLVMTQPDKAEDAET